MIKKVFVFTCICLGFSAAYAADNFFDNDGGDELFGTATNWSDDALPDAQTVIAGGLTSRVESADSFSGLGNLFVGGTTDGPAGTGALIVDGEVHVDIGGGDTVIGSNNRAGELVLNDGALMTTTNHFRAGRNGGGGGTVNIFDAELDIGHDFIISTGGGTSNFSRAFINQMAGTVSVTNTGANVNIGQSNNAFGTYNLSGGSLSIGQHLNFGSLGTGSGFLNLSGTGELNAGNHLHFRKGVATIDGGLARSGQVTTSGDVNIGTDANSDALVVVNGGMLQAGDQVFIGASSATNSMGMLQVDGGTVTANNSITIRDGFLAIGNGLVEAGTGVLTADVNIGLTNDMIVGEVELSGGELRVAEHLNIRQGSLQQMGGTLTIGVSTNTADLNVGTDTGGVGMYSIHDGVVNIPDNLNMGNNAQTGIGQVDILGGDLAIGRLLNIPHGTVVQSNGTVAVSVRPSGGGGLAVGSGVGQLGTYIMHGGSLRSENYINVGANLGNGDGFLELHGGTMVASNSVAVRKGRVLLAGGEITSTENLFVGGNSNQDGELIVNGGKVSALAQLQMGQTASNGVGRIAVDGGQVDIVSHFQARRGMVEMNSGMLTVGNNLNLAVDDGAEASFMFAGGELFVTNVFTVGRNNGGAE